MLSKLFSLKKLAIYVLLVSLAISASTCKPFFKNLPTAQATEPAVGAAIPLTNETPEATPTVIPAALTPAPFVWDNTFDGNLGNYYESGDDGIAGFRTEGAQMEYTCKYAFGVYMTMDPGEVQHVSSGELGVVAFVPCTPGAKIIIHTSYWSTSSLHNQIHLVEVNQPLPASIDYRSVLIALQDQEKKPMAFFFKLDGTYETIR